MQNVIEFLFSHILHPMTLSPVLTEISIQAYQTEAGWYSLAQYQSKVPGYVWDAVYNKGAVYITTYPGLLYEFLFDKVYSMYFVV